MDVRSGVQEKTILEIVDLEWFKIVEELFYW